MTPLPARFDAVYADTRVKLAAGAEQGHRHWPAEQAAAERLRRAGFAGPAADGQWVLRRVDAPEEI